MFLVIFGCSTLLNTLYRCTSLKKICTFFGIYIDIKMRLFALSTIDVSKEAR